MSAPVASKPTPDMTDAEWAAKVEEVRADANRRRRLFQRIGDIEVKPPDYLIKGVLECATLASDFGASGDGKTFVAIDKVCSVATGTPYHEHEIVDPGPVVYIAGEGHAGLKRRFLAWETRHGVDLSTAPIYVSSRPIPLGDHESLGPAIVEIDEIAATEGELRLIVIDTLSRNIAGDENSSYDMPAFVRALDYLKARYNAAVLVVHHTGHSAPERSRGHSAFKAALDWEYRVERDPAGIIRVECTKAKDAEPPAPLAFALRVVELDLQDEEGNAVTSAVLDRVEYEPRTAPSRRIGGKWQQLAIDTLKAEADRHCENVVASGRDQSEARVSVDAWRDACLSAGMPRQRFHQAKTALYEKSVIDLSHGFVHLSETSVRPSAVRPLTGGGGQSGQRTMTEADKADAKRTEKRTESGQQEGEHDLDIF